MSALTTARLEFAVTAGVHFLFVLVTLGLVTQVAIAQTRWAITGKPVYERMTRFWGQLYVINYAIGIATGLVMEFQFGLNWTGLSALTGDVFGAPLAMETLIAFFLESTLLGMWIFSWGRLRRGVQVALIWGVALTAYLSAFWVMVANSFLQHPVGYTITDGRARLTDIGALLTNPNLGMATAHIVSAALLVGGLLVVAVAAWHGRRGGVDLEFLRRSARMGLLFAAVGSIMVVGFGFAQIPIVDDTQPTKLVDSADSAAAQAAMVAAHGPGDYLAPGWVSGAFAGMILIGMLLVALVLLMAPFLLGDLLVSRPLARPAAVLARIGLGFALLAAVAGWLVREGGRQPWTVYGLLSTRDALSDLRPGTMLASLLGFGALVIALAVLDAYLLVRFARRGPGREFLPDQAPEPGPDHAPGGSFDTLTAVG